MKNKTLRYREVELYSSYIENEKKYRDCKGYRRIEILDPKNGSVLGLVKPIDHGTNTFVVFKNYAYIVCDYFEKLLVCGVLIEGDEYYKNIKREEFLMY